MVALGFLYLIITFLICFTAVHFIKLAAIGLFSFKKKREPAPEKKPDKKPEPVYYIVEKKRSKKTYSEPKEIKFKD